MAGIEERIKSYREEKFRLRPGRHLNSLEDAVEFIDSRGVVAFWPVTGIPVPNLWAAAAGDRPVADSHDDPGHITWGWKDEIVLHGTFFYGRILCGRNFFVNHTMLPGLFALSGFTGNIHDDHLVKYEAGELSRTAYMIYDTILKNGPMDTIEINKSIRLFGSPAKAEYTRALATLQEQLMVLPVGISTSGRWHYSFIYDLVLRHFSGLPADAARISDQQARSDLLCCYLDSAGSATFTEIYRLFKWPGHAVKISMQKLVSENWVLETGFEQNGKPVAAYIIPELV